MKNASQRRTYSVEFKKEVMAKLDGGMSVAEVAEKHGLTIQTIYKWRRQLRDKELDMAVDRAPRVEQSGVSPKYVRQLEEKLRESNEKLGELYLVVDALKKMDQGSMKSASSYIVSGNNWVPLKRRAK